MIGNSDSVGTEDRSFDMERVHSNGHDMDVDNDPRQQISGRKSLESAKAAEKSMSTIKIVVDTMESIHNDCRPC